MNNNSSNNNELHNNGSRGDGRDRYIVDDSTFTSGLRQICNEQPSKLEARNTIMVSQNKIISRLLAARREIFDNVTNYTDLYNSWSNASFAHKIVYRKERTRTPDGVSYWDVHASIEWKCSEGVLKITKSCCDTCLKVANNEVCKNIMQQFVSVLPVVQMDSGPSKESIQGDATQESVQNSNTIITRDQGETVSTDVSLSEEFITKCATSEEVYYLDKLVGRWMPLQIIKVTTTNQSSDCIKTWYLPEDLLKYGNDIGAGSVAPNVLPFETFVYGQYDIKMRFVVNANKFQCGKVLVSALFDSYQIDTMYNTMQSALMRPHVMLDLSSNNEAELEIPFKYRRTFIRNSATSSSRAIRPLKYATVFVHVLSPLNIGPDQPNKVDIRAFYMFSRAQFAGMSYRVPLVQMDTLLQAGIQATAPAIKKLVVGVEKTLDQLGKSHNQDKPTDIKCMTIIPRPRMHFGNGKGISDAIPLRNSVTALTSFQHVKASPNDPVSTLDIAKIWGLRSAFKWSTSQTDGVTLFEMVVDPALRSYKEDYLGQVTPLEFVCGMYNFWSGPIDMRFDFVSNSFHTGAVIISAEFNRESSTATQSFSTYTKTFHLGEQKSVDFRIPYIYDTVWRRNTGLPYIPLVDDNTTSDEIRRTAIGLRPEVKTKVKVRIINELVPIQSAPQVIEVLVYWRASKNFFVHGLCQSNFFPSAGIGLIDNFPCDYYEIQQPRTNQVFRTTQSESVSQQKYGSTSRSVPNTRRAQQPHTQMDNGEKEDEDETHNFKTGYSSAGIQNYDIQTDILDIVRRPVLLLNRAKVVKSQFTGYFIALQPPTYSFSYLANMPFGDFNKLISRTPQCQLLSAFRYWRGSMRYTIVLHNVLNTPVYVTHVPHSGARIFGNYQLSKNADDAQAQIYASGLTTDMIISRVNPTATYEVPFDTENNWVLTFDENNGRHFSWRDKGDTNTGHLVVTSMQDVTMDVWWSAGDDFQLSNFIGTPQMKSNMWAYQASDDVPYTQMDSDFMNNNVATSVSALKNTVKQMFSPNKLMTTGVCMIPGVGQAYAMSTGLHMISDVKENVEAKIDSLVTTFGTTLDNLQGMIKNSIEKVMSGFTCGVNMVSLCTDALLDILIAWMDKSWKALGMGIVRLVVKVSGFGIMSKVIHYATQIGDLISQALLPPVATVQAPSREVTMTGVLAGLTGTVLGVTIDPRRCRPISLSCLERLTSASGVSYLVGILRFVESVFYTIKDFVLSSLGYVSPEAEAVKMLARGSPVIDKFVTDAQLITSEANASLVHNANFRVKFWKTVMQATQIQKLLLSVPENIASPHLMKLCTEVIRVGNEKFVDISAAPVRYEPFVICIEGAPGVGKSDMVEKLVSVMMEKVNLNRPHSGATYYRTPGNKFWSGYKDQLVVVYDDWMNVVENERMVQQISELYQLKSTSIFIPEMAHLEEKKIRGNPLCVILLCNNAFPDFAMNSIVHTPEAVYRRRDVLLHARRKEEYENVNLREMSIHDQENIAQMEFTQYTNPTDKESKLSVYRDFSTVADWVARKFEVWNAQETIKVKRRMSNLQSGMQRAEVAEVRLEDPFQLYYSTQYELSALVPPSPSGVLPSELLALEVNALIARIDQHQRAEPANPVVPSEPDNIFIGAQMDNGETMTAIGNGLLWSRTVMSQALHYTRTAINTMYHKLMQFVSNSHYQCCVCQEIKRIHYVCSSSERVVVGQSPREGVHYVCGECVSMATTAGAPISTCPMCRSPDLSIYIDSEEHSYLSTAISLIGSGVYTVDSVLGAIQRSYATTQYQAVRIILEYISICKALYDRNYPLATSRLTSFTVDSLASAFLPGVQVDEEPFGEVEAPVVEDVQPGIDSVLRLEFRDDLIDNARDFITENHQTTPCLHAFFGQYIESVRYNDGNFCVPLTGGSIMLTEEPCKRLDCHWRLSNKMEDDYRELFRLRYNHYYQHVIGYYNLPDQDYHLKRIPKFFRPSWMDPRGNVASELTTITSKPWWAHLGEMFTAHKTLILALGGTITAISGLLVFYKLFDTQDPAEPQSGREYDAGYTRQIRQRTRQLQRNKTTRPHFQSGEDPTLGDVCQKYIAKNAVQIIVMDKEKKKHILLATGIFNSYALLPRHYVKALKKWHAQGCEFMICKAMLTHEMSSYTFDEDDFTISPTTDLALWKVPKSFGFFKDIRKFFATDDDLLHPITTYGTLIVPPNSRCDALRVINVDIKGIQNTEVVQDSDGEKFTAWDVIAYNYSQPGACGSLLLLEKTTRPIVAMHFAGIGTGSTGEGYGVILTTEAFGEILDLKVTAQFDDFEYDDLEDAKIIFPADINVSYIGALPKELTPYAPKKTKLRPSQIHKVAGLKPFTEPTVLDKSDSRWEHDDTPLISGCKKHGRLTRDFSSSLIKRCKETLWDGWLSRMKPCVIGPKKLTPEEACVGLGIEYYDPIDLNTSAGWPYVCTRKKQKQDYVTFERDATLKPIDAVIDQEVLTRLKENENKRTQGIAVNTLYVDSLKDEKRKPEKVRAEGGTRVFCNPPLENVIAMRQNFLHFTAAFMKDRFNQQHAIGINAHGTEWTQLARRLINISFENIVTLDYSNFGPGFNACIAEAAKDLIKQWTLANVDNVDEVELDCLLAECINSVHACNNTVYQQKCGSPSGATITTPINSLVNLLYILVAWASLIDPEGDYLWEEYKKHVCLFVYGDDLIMAVSDKYIEKFNAKTITEFFSKYGITATDASKSSEIIPYTPLTQATFLKRGFRKHDDHEHIWQSFLDWKSINDCTQWIWESADHKSATRENCEAALEYAHGWGKEKFAKFKREVNIALQQVGIDPLLITWEEIDKKFYPDLVIY
uniref:Genome polyprotein n=1 Tax=Xiangshan picorna-like virus 1 TaxID=2886217 RepID=A0A8K1YQN2_9VIRU|nr:MAG: polyprotein [Xiangshan picorna-like virus 1]